MSTVSYRQSIGSGAQNYERFFVPAIGRPAAAPLLDAASIGPGERVLDVACGTGVVARLSATLVGPDGAVAGLDVNPDMIEVARGLAAPAEPEIDWRVGDAASLPFPDASFDVVTCQMGLMFMDAGAAVAEMRRVLVPGGRVVASTPGRMQPFFQLLHQAVLDHLGADLGRFVAVVFSMSDPGAIAALLRGAGLVDVTATQPTVALDLPEPRKFLWQYVSSTPMAPAVASAPEDVKAALERQVADRAGSLVVDGRVPVDQPIVVATGRRPPA